MVHGAPFPSLYEWTLGELNEYISCEEERKQNDLRMQALMDFKHANLIAKLSMGSKGEKVELMEEYDFLWSQEERNEMRRRQIEARFRVAHK